MTKHISDSERLTLAMLNRKETELKQTREDLDQLKKQLRVMSDYITELKKANKILSAQVRYLVHKDISHA
jgi:septal ring factor EnvC (AmiA/AmiB activator)